VFGHSGAKTSLHGCVGSATSDELLQRRSMYRVSAQRTVSVVSALATLTLLAGLVQQSSSTTAPNKLLLLLIDGFRWDYFDKIPSDQLPGFTRLRQNGVAVEAFVPAFPSLSFVNYYTIMTGNRIIMQPLTFSLHLRCTRKKIVTRMVTRDLFAVANVRVLYIFCRSASGVKRNGRQLHVRPQTRYGISHRK